MPATASGDVASEPEGSETTRPYAIDNFVMTSDATGLGLTLGVSVGTGGFGGGGGAIAAT